MRRTADTWAVDAESIRRYWEEQGRADRPATSRDPFLAELERADIEARLDGSMDTLEVGCGDGIHTVRYARRVRRLTAIDIAGSLLDRARERLAAEGIGAVELVRASVLEAADRFGTASFDAVISQRCLINLPTWELQRSALEQIHDVLRTGGIFLLTEGFQEDLERMNAMRDRCGLEPIAAVPHNRFLERSALEAFARDRFAVLERGDYGLYLFLSRVVHPLAVHPRAPRHDDPLNEAAMRVARAVRIDELAPISYDAFYAFRKI